MGRLVIWDRRGVGAGDSDGADADSRLARARLGRAEPAGAALAMNDLLLAVLAALVTLIILAYGLGKERGRDEAHAEIEEGAREAERKRDEIDKDVSARPDDQLDRDLDKWMRD